MIIDTLGGVIRLSPDDFENQIVLSPFNEDVALLAAFSDEKMFVFEDYNWMRSSFQTIQDCLTGRSTYHRVLKFGDWGHYADFGLFMRTINFSNQYSLFVEPKMLICPVISEENVELIRKKDFVNLQECIRKNPSLITLWYSEDMEIGRDPNLNVVENERLAKYKRIWNAVKVDFAELHIPIIRKTAEEMNSLFFKIQLQVPSITNSDDWKRTLIDNVTKQYSVDGYEPYRKVGS